MRAIEKVTKVVLDATYFCGSAISVNVGPHSVRRQRRTPKVTWAVDVSFSLEVVLLDAVVLARAIGGSPEKEKGMKEHDVRASTLSCSARTTQIDSDDSILSPIK